MGKKILAGVLGGLAFFVWSSLAHMVLGLGEIGMKDLPDEDSVMAALHAKVAEDGFYRFPGLHLPPGASFAQRGEAMDAASKKAATGPVGLMIFHPGGDPGLTARRLVIELLTNILQVMLAVLLLGQTSLTSFAARWRFITIAGVLAAVTTNISYWNWYGFPGNYTRAYIAMTAVGFACAGLVAAALVKPEAKSMSAVR